MGLFDQLAGQVLGTGGGQAGLIAQVVQFIQQGEGGLPGFIERLQNGGLAAEVTSWLGDGDNLPVTAQQIASALGDGFVGGLAAKVGMSEADLTSALTTLLPQAIDALSSGGKLKATDELMGQGLAMLGGLFGGKG